MTSTGLPIPLRKRQEFVTATKQGLRYVTPAFIVQLVKSAPPDTDMAIRFGLTASKKIGNAVARNRARRRLRPLAKHVLARQGQPDCYYVFVARAQALHRNYAQMCNDAKTAIKRLHSKARVLKS